MGLKDIARLTDLFVEGTEVVLQDDPTEPMLLWANKLNSFEAEEARRDGQAARSRVVLALKEIGSAESDTFEAALTSFTAEQLVQELLGAKNSERFIDAIDSVQRDKDWAERLSIVQRRGDAITAEEAALIAKIDDEYAAEVDERIANARSQEERDLARFGLEELQEKYREAWRNQRGMAAFTREYNKTRLYFSIRVCSAKRSPSGGWDHGHCGGHRKRVLDDRDEVVSLPEGLLDLLLRVSQDVNVDRREARFLAGTPSSSASSAPPSEAVESTASTPEETSPELATTSS